MIKKDQLKSLMSFMIICTIAFYGLYIIIIKPNEIYKHVIMIIVLIVYIKLWEKVIWICFGKKENKK